MVELNQDNICQVQQEHALNKKHNFLVLLYEAVFALRLFILFMLALTEKCLLSININKLKTHKNIISIQIEQEAFLLSYLCYPGTQDLKLIPKLHHISYAVNHRSDFATKTRDTISNLSIIFQVIVYTKFSLLSYCTIHITASHWFSF